MCHNNEITLVLIPSLSRVFNNISKAKDSINEILGCSNQVSIFSALESMHFTDDEFTINYLKILTEMAERESEQKSRAMISYIYPRPRQINHKKEEEQ